MLLMAQQNALCHFGFWRNHFLDFQNLVAALDPMVGGGMHPNKDESGTLFC